MQKYQNNVTGRNGDVVIGGSVLITLAGTSTPATIYSDAGVTPVANPLTTDANGYFEFYAADGTYDISVNGTEAYTAVPVVDALAGLAGRPTASELAASGGAALIGALVEGTVQTAIDARPTSAALAASGGAGLVKGTWFGGVVAWLSDMGTSIGSSLIGFIQIGAGTVARSVQDRFRDIVSLKDFGAIGDGTSHPLSERFASLALAQAVYPHATSLTDEIDWAATQAAVKVGKPIDAPAGTFILNRTVFENTNGGAVSMRGALGYRKTVFQLKVGVAGIASFHFGNNNGHGSYRLKLANIHIKDPNGLASGNTGVIAQEAGNSHFTSISAEGIGTGVHLVSSTDVVFDGRQEFSTCGVGIYGTAPTTIKTTQPITDVTVTTVFSPNNDVRIKNGWFTGGDRAIYIEGDLVEISGCCCQSVGSDGTEHLIEVNNTVFQGASFKGPNIHGNWVEGGHYKYFIATIKASGGDIYDNYIIGKGSADVPTGAEGGVFVDSKQTTVRDNRAFQYFAWTPQDGRLANAVIYVSSFAQSSVNVRDNTLYRSQAGNQYYFAGRAAPTLSNTTRADVWGHVAIAAGVGTLSNGANIASLVQFSGTGTWQVNFSFNFESLTCPVFITPLHATPLIVAYAWNGAGSVRIRFHDAAGALTDPTGFSIQVLGERVLN